MKYQTISLGATTARLEGLVFNFHTPCKNVKVTLNHRALFNHMKINKQNR